MVNSRPLIQRLDKAQAHQVGASLARHVKAARRHRIEIKSVGDFWNVAPITTRVMDRLDQAFGG